MVDCFGVFWFTFLYPFLCFLHEIDISGLYNNLLTQLLLTMATEKRTVTPTLSFKKLSLHAKAPIKGSEQAAGYDLFSAEVAVIKPGGRVCIKTDLELSIPFGCYGRIAPRSGLAAKYGIDVGAGVVDSDYRGNVTALLFNFGTKDFHVTRGDRIAQLILEKIHHAELVEVKYLDSTARGNNGFGSTGSGGFNCFDCLELMCSNCSNCSDVF